MSLPPGERHRFNQSEDVRLNVALRLDGPEAQLLRKLTTEFEGEHEPDVIRYCGWSGSSGVSQLCCRRRFEDAGGGASSAEPRAEARAGAHHESGLVGVRARSHKECTRDPTRRKDAACSCNSLPVSPGSGWALASVSPSSGTLRPGALVFRRVEGAESSPGGHRRSRCVRERLCAEGLDRPHAGDRERHGRVGRILRGRQFVPRAAPGSTTGGVEGHWNRHNTPLGYGWYHSAPGEHGG